MADPTLNVAKDATSGWGTRPFHFGAPLFQKVGVRVSVVVLPEDGTEIEGKASCSLMRDGRDAQTPASAGAEMIHPSITLSVDTVARFQE